jgi:hypothetical protein
MTSDLTVFVSLEDGKYSAKIEVPINGAIESTLNEFMQAAFGLNTRFFVYHNGTVVKIKDTFWS